MKNDSPVGIVLLQLGGPDSLESVEPFLLNLFKDPDIIDLPLAFLFRGWLARTISRRRAPKVQEYYRRIGGKSPILKLTNRQARALERELTPDIRCKVYVAMRYWHPFTEKVIDQLYKDGINRVILLPLYPHFSKTTTGSSVNEWNRILSRKKLNGLAVDVVEEYCEHPLYIQSIVRNITIALRRVREQDRPNVHLVFSAHGTPTKLVKAGDPYQQHILRTYNAVLGEGNFGLSHHLCYQSKVGPEQWLEPSLETTIRKLATEQVSHVIVIPIAFVSDHSETLWEINIQVKEEAKQLGIRYYDMSPALNTNPLFIKALADLVRNRVDGGHV
jgi:ferrochelatase